MATVTGLTSERMLDIEGQSVVDGEVINGRLILTKHVWESFQRYSLGRWRIPGSYGHNRRLSRQDR